MIETGLENPRNGLEKVLNLVLRKVWEPCVFQVHNVIMSAIASQITGVSIVYSTFCSGADQSKHQIPASLAIVRGFHW